MRENRLALYVHLVGATWDRWPLITPEIESDVHHTLRGLAQRAGCKVLALGGTENHVHLLVEIPATLSVSALIRSIKGASAHWINETLQPSSLFKWQGSYAAFTVSRWDVKNISAYVKNQKEHHAAGTILPLLELQTAEAV